MVFSRFLPMGDEGVQLIVQLVSMCGRSEPVLDDTWKIRVIHYLFLTVCVLPPQAQPCLVSFLISRRRLGENSLPCYGGRLDSRREEKSLEAMEGGEETGAIEN
ncbi:unnamed protein product [Brassica oleracea]